MKAAQSKGRVSSNLKISAGYFKLRVSSPRIAGVARPGQFVMLQVNSGIEPLLKRPLSIHRVNTGTIELLYEVVGRGTELLSKKQPGEFLDVIGPLGNGFDYLTPNTKHLTPILVSGGMGVAPLVFLAEKLTEVKSQKSKVKSLVLIGAKTKSHILCEKEFKELGCTVKVATDDGSKGFKGRVSDLLNETLTTNDQRPTTIYACGPAPMLKAVSKISADCNLPAQISLETHMACGFGACLGCIVNTRDGYKRVCKEGPVFRAEEITWEQAG